MDNGQGHPGDGGDVYLQKTPRRWWKWKLSRNTQEIVVMDIDKRHPEGSGGEYWPGIPRK